MLKSSAKITTLRFRKWLINTQICNELLVYHLYQSGEDKEGNLYKGIAAFMVFRLKQFTPFVVQVIPQPSQANPEVTFNGQWLVEKIRDNIDNLIEIGLSARGIVTGNHPANVSAFSALKNIQFGMKLLYETPVK